MSAGLTDPFQFDLGGTLKDALGGSLNGAVVMVMQVLALMPLRTIMNYQYRYGSATTQTTRTLYADGGWTRYYQGLAAALVQALVSRFCDAVASVGVLALLKGNKYTRDLPALAQVIFVSLTAPAFRMVLTPIDTVKTAMHTDGRAGLAILLSRIKRYGIGTMWSGALATTAATFVGRSVWFGTYNGLNAALPPARPRTAVQKLLRRAFVGFCASVVSDAISNCLCVVKTYRQVHQTPIGYVAAAEAVIAQDGLRGLFGRGLETRILADCLQDLMFSML